MLLDTAMFVGGFVLLVKGADWLVNGASALARAVGVSDLVIGLTVVAFGTSTPELVVSVFAAMRGSADLSIGNIVGSNICNIFLILGLSSVICPLFAARGTVWKEIPFMLLAAGALLVACNDALLDGMASSSISRADGVLFLLFFAIFLVYIAQVVTEVRAVAKAVRPRLAAKSAGLLVAGLVMLFVGARWVVGGAVELARFFGISESLVGLTVVALGTSLPELATSAVAAYRKNSEIAVGNIVGSNIFNVLLILGVSALVTPLPCRPGLNADLAAMATASLLLFAAMFLGKPRHQVQRVEGAVFLILYAGYVVWAIDRG